MARDYDFVRNAAGALTTAGLITVAVVVKIVVAPFERPRGLTQAQVAKVLRNFLNGDGGEWDWDDFVCGGVIRDPELENVRREAAEIELPLDEAGRSRLEGLLQRVERLAH